MFFNDVFMAFKKIKYRIIFLILFVATITCTTLMMYEANKYYDYGWGGVFLANIIIGIPIATIEEISMPPIQWLLLILSASVLSADIIYEDFYELGKQKIIKIGRGKWWNIKYLCAIIHGILFYAIVYVIPFILLLIYNKKCLQMKNDLVFYKCGFGDLYADKVLLAEYAFVLPLLSILAIVIWTQLLGLFLKPDKALLLMTIYVVSGIYFFNPFFVANQWMIRRSIVFYDAGYTFEQSIIMDFILIICAYFVGRKYLKEKMII